MDRKMKLKLLMILPFILEIIALFFLPTEIPIHYDSALQVDGYGSKYYLLILGIFVIIFGLFMNWIYAKSINTKNETLIYRLSIVALVIFNVMNVLFICGSLIMGTSISIIGGADGPTTIFLAGSLGDGIPFLLIIGILIGVGIWRFKCKK